MSRHRNFCFTYNNYPDTSLVDNVACKFIAYSKEVAPTSGTPHLQGYICFHNAKSKASVISLLPGCHISVMRGSLAENEEYCSKSADLIQRGVAPITNENKGRGEQIRWATALSLARSGKLDDIDPDILIRCYSSLKSIAKDHMVKPPPCDVKCFWIHGPTGTGKSHSVETTFPDCYKKNMDDMKWFDGYIDQKVIYLEDFDVYQVRWGGMMKRLADRWPMQASIKGSMRYIRPEVVIVTSNVTPEQVWQDPATLDPILRRFKLVLKVNQSDVIDFA